MGTGFALHVFAQSAEAREAIPLLLSLPEATVLKQGQVRGEWNYTFLRDNREDRVFSADQTLIGTRRNHRKTHLVTWRLKHGLTENLQPEAEIVYEAYRQHTHGDGDSHDRNDDGDFRRLFAGLSYQLLRASREGSDLRLRGGILFPRRAETEGIGEELGVDLLAVAGRSVGEWSLTGALGFAMTFDNHDHPADSDFTQAPLSKGHDLRTLTYGIGVSRPLNEDWRVNLELDGRLFDTIRLNERVSRSELRLTPGLFRSWLFERWDSWVGLGLPIGLTTDAEHIGVALRTGVRF